jgi:hypothetical protein
MNVCCITTYTLFSFEKKSHLLFQLKVILFEITKVKSAVLFHSKEYLKHFIT